ncbi:MAG: ArsR/SmtB family transcription factor [Armatimonadota bacterium]
MAAVESVFKAMGDPTRIQIIKMLSENGEMCVCKITEELAMMQPAVSHHLSALKNAGLVTAKRKGQWSYYSLCADTLSNTILAFITELLEKHQSSTAATDENLQDGETPCCQ